MSHMPSCSHILQLTIDFLWHGNLTTWIPTLMRHSSFSRAICLGDFLSSLRSLFEVTISTVQRQHREYLHWYITITKPAYLAKRASRKDAAESHGFPIMLDITKNAFKEYIKWKFHLNSDLSTKKPTSVTSCLYSFLSQSWMINLQRLWDEPTVTNISSSHGCELYLYVNSSDM